MPSSPPAGAGGSDSPGGERAWSRVAPVYARSFADLFAATPTTKGDDDPWTSSTN